MQGLDRMRIEEPIRELVLDLDDRILRRESTLDARRNGVDLDRGEIIPVQSMWNLNRTVFLTGVDLNVLRRYVKLPTDYAKPIDTAAVVLVGRALAAAHRHRAQRLLLRVNNRPNGTPVRRHEQYLLDRSNCDVDLARRWAALSKTMLESANDLQTVKS
jgi:hypothetical protein